MLFGFPLPRKSLGNLSFSDVLYVTDILSAGADDVSCTYPKCSNDVVLYWAFGMWFWGVAQLPPFLHVESTIASNCISHFLCINDTRTCKVQ